MSTKEYCIGVEYVDFPMGASPWYRTNAIDRYTLQEAKAECKRRNDEVATKNYSSCSYPVWSFRLTNEQYCNQETGEPE